MPKLYIPNFRDDYTSYQNQYNINFDSTCVYEIGTSSGHDSYCVQTKGYDTSNNNRDTYFTACYTYDPVYGYFFRRTNITTSTSYKSCRDDYTVTDNIYYHPKLDSILIIFFIILLICFYFPYRIISRLFGRWLSI